MPAIYVFVAVLAFELLLDHHMPFRGLFPKHLVDRLSPEELKHYAIGWMPTWWLMIACSFFMIGVAFCSSVWAFVAALNNEPIVSPMLLGLSAVIGSFATLVVPIVTAWFKDRADSRNSDQLKSRVVELERELQITKAEHGINQANIKKIAEVTQKVVDQTPGVNENIAQEIRESRKEKESGKAEEGN